MTKKSRTTLLHVLVDFYSNTEKFVIRSSDIVFNKNNDMSYQQLVCHLLLYFIVLKQLIEFMNSDKELKRCSIFYWLISELSLLSGVTLRVFGSCKLNYAYRDQASYQHIQMIFFKQSRAESNYVNIFIGFIKLWMRAFFSI